MKRKLYFLLPFIMLAVVFTACDETEEVGQYDNWQARNDAFIDSLQHVVDTKADDDLLFFKDETNGRTIFYKKLDPVPVAEDAPIAPPFFTSNVDVYYRGMYIDEAVFSAHPNEKYYTRLHRELPVFNNYMVGDDPNRDLDQIYTFSVSGTVTGFSTILMHMKPGDRWEVYIPYQSGYLNSNATGITDIQRYATLIYDLTMVDIDYYPTR